MDANFEVGLYSHDAGNDVPLNRLFVDNTNEKIVLRDRYLFFKHRERVIPFAGINRVVIDRKVDSRGTYGSEFKWILSIVVGSAKVVIEDSKNEWEMWSLGQCLSQITGKEMVDRSSGNGEAKFNPNISREEIVEKWKKQINSPPGCSRETVSVLWSLPHQNHY